MRHTTAFTFVVAAFALSALSVVACGGGAAEAPPPAAAPEAAPKEQAGPPVPQVSQDLGSIDPNATQAAFDALGSRMNGCYQDGLKRVPYLSGDAKLFVRIGQDGRAKYAYLEDSTIGEADTERCLVDALMAATWPKPQGGEAEARNSIGFDLPEDVRPPAPWSSDRIAEQLGKHDHDFRKCKGKTRGTFHVTAYVEKDDEKPKPHEKHAPKKKPHPGKGASPEDAERGKIQAIGIVPPGRDGADKVDCLLDVVKSMELPSPGSYAAKVSFIL